MLTASNIFFEKPLYANMKGGTDFIINTLFAPNQRIDFYSIDLKENTTYSVHFDFGIYGSHFNSFSEETGGFFEATLSCVRTNRYFRFFFYYNKNTQNLIKVGQLPSIADLHISKIKQFDKVLSKEKLKEFTRAIGLAANGVGIGSFVYLRRIFEDLIEEAHQKAKLETGWDKDIYAQARMSEKIALLKHQLPVFLVENKELYSILSLGIHSLTEDDCLAYFETVKLGIELILEEKAEKLAKQKRLEDAKGKIAQLKSNITK